MAEKKQIKVHNKSDKPDNVVLKEQEIIRQCQEIEAELPSFLRGFFAYLRGNVLPMTRLAYLHDIRFFCNYLISETALSDAEETRKIKLSDFQEIMAVDINAFIDYCRRYETETETAILVHENNNKTLARKKSSLSLVQDSLLA